VPTILQPDAVGFAQRIEEKNTVAKRLRNAHQHRTDSPPTAAAENHFQGKVSDRSVSGRIPSLLGATPIARIH
jgi:hypothetical protein